MRAMSPSRALVLLPPITVLLGCSAQVPEKPAAQNVGGKADLFGEDNRSEVYEVPAGSVARKVANATAAMFRGDVLERNANGVWLPSKPIETLAERKDLCEDEAYADQPSLSACTAFLVSEDLVLTAGHCIKQRTCSELSFAFDFAYFDASELGEFPVVRDENRYECADLIENHTDSCDDDWALVRLDRPTGREPLVYRRQDDPDPDTPLLAVGYPQGIPAKVSHNARVREVDALKLHTDLDIFGGNSGSPVVDAVTGQLEGIHVCSQSGNTMEDPNGRSCLVALQCGEDGADCSRWAEATKLSRIADVIDRARGIVPTPNP